MRDGGDKAPSLDGGSLRRLFLQAGESHGCLRGERHPGLLALTGQLGQEGEPGLAVAPPGRPETVLRLEQRVALDLRLALVVIPPRPLLLLAAMDHRGVLQEARPCRVLVAPRGLTSPLDGPP